MVGRDRVGKSSFVDSLLNKLFDRRKPSTKGVAIDVAMINTEGWNVNTAGKHSCLDQYVAAGLMKAERQDVTGTHVTPIDVTPIDVTPIGVTPDSGCSPTTTVEEQLGSEDQTGSISPDTSEESETVRQLSSTADMSQRTEGLLVKYRSDPKLFQDLEKTKFGHIFDFGGQEHFLITHPGLIPDSSRFKSTAYAVVSKMSELLTDDAVETVYKPDRQSDDIVTPLMSLKTNADFVKCHLTTIKIAHDDSDCLSNYLGRSDNMRFPPIFPVATFFGEEAARKNVERNNEILNDIVKAIGCENNMVKKPGTTNIEFFCVDNTKSGPGNQETGVEIIKDILDRMTEDYFEKEEEQPLTWVQLERLLLDALEKTGSSILTTQDINLLADRLCKIGDPEEVQVALLYIAHMGSILYYPTAEFLRNIVFTSPQRVIFVFATFVSPTLPHDKSLPEKAVERVLDSGVMKWELAQALFQKSGTPENEYAPMLELLYMFDIACPADAEAVLKGTERRPMQSGMSLFLPCLLDHHFEGTTRYQQWSVENGLPPPLILLPDGVDMIPESLFFRLETRCIAQYGGVPELKRDRCVLPIPYAALYRELCVELLHVNKRYIAATVFVEATEKIRKISSDVLSPHYAQLRRFLWRNINDAKQKGMRCLQLKLFCHHRSQGPCDLSQEMPSEECDELHPDLPPTTATRPKGGDSAKQKRLHASLLWYDGFDFERVNSSMEEQRQETEHLLTAQVQQLQDDSAPFVPATLVPGQAAGGLEAKTSIKRKRKRPLRHDAAATTGK